MPKKTKQPEVKLSKGQALQVWKELYFNETNPEPRVKKNISWERLNAFDELVTFLIKEF